MLEIIVQAMTIFFVFLTTLCFGSFLNVVIYRLPNKMSLVKPASHCPKCGQPIKWYDNIPIVSYLVLKGKCRNCENKIPIRYFMVECGTSIFSTLIYCFLKNKLIAILIILMFFCFIAIFFIDMEHYIIPNSLIIVITLLGIIETIIYPDGYMKYDTYISKLIMLAISVIIFASVVLIEKKSNREIIGGGDLKLLASVGLFLGWQYTFLGLGIASIIGAIIELTFRNILKRNKDEKGSSILPFGPYLVIGFLVAMLFGNYIFDWYFSLFSI